MISGNKSAIDLNQLTQFLEQVIQVPQSVCETQFCSLHSADVCARDCFKKVCVCVCVCGGGGGVLVLVLFSKHTCIMKSPLSPHTLIPSHTHSHPHTLTPSHSHSLLEQVVFSCHSLLPGYRRSLSHCHGYQYCRE